MNSETTIAKEGNPKEKQKKIQIKLEWVFGIRNDLFPNIYMLDSDTVVYPAGHYVVIFNVSKKLPQNQLQKFIIGTPHSRGFTAINTYNSHKRYVATAEELSEGVNISIYTVNNQMGQFNVPTKIANVDLFDSRVSKVYHIAFSQRDQTDNYFAAVGIADDPVVVLWKWDQDTIKDKTVIPIKLPNNKYKFLNINFSVFKNDNFNIISDQFILSYTIQGKMLSNTGVYHNPSGNILSHCWFYDGHFCIATESNIVILDSTFKPYQIIPTYDEINKTFISYVLPSYESEKFIAVGNNKRFEIYERKKSEYYERVLSKTFEDKNEREKSDKDKNFDFHSLTAPTNAADEFILATTSNNDLIQISLKDIEKQFNYKHLISQFHSDCVEGLDIAINKPYIITCSKDKSLKVWDYKTRSLTLNKTFEEEMYSVAYHPSGMHCIVSFEDKIIPMNVYYDEISNMTQNGIQARKSKDIKFSHGGQFFAYDSANKVEIWDFMNMQNYNQLKSSFHTSKLNFIAWREDDQYLLVCGYESIYEWKLHENPPQPPNNRHNHKTFNYTSGNYLGRSQVIIASADDSSIRNINEIDMNVSKINNSVKEMYIFKNNKFMVSTTLPENHRSTENKDLANNVNVKEREVSGMNFHTQSNVKTTTCIRFFPDLNNKYEFIDVPSHFGETSRLRINYDENLLFTCGSDGCVNIYSIDLLSEGDDSDKYYFEKISDNFTNTVLIKKSKLKEKEIEKLDAPEKREELLKKIKSSNLEERDKLTKLVDSFKNKLATTKQTELKIIGQKKNELESLIMNYEQQITHERTFNAQVYEKQMNDYQVELANKSREVEKIRENLREHKQHHKEEMNNLKRNNDEMKNNTEKKYLDQIQTLEIQKKELEDSIEILNKKKSQDDKALGWLNDKVLEVIDKNISELTKGIEDLNVHNMHQEKKLNEEIERQIQQMNNLENELNQIKEEKQKQKVKKDKNTRMKQEQEEIVKEIQKRISDVEMRIIEGKKKNQYLEKCKFVLDYKIKELKKEMGPIEKAIEDLKKKTKQLENSLEKFNREHDIINRKMVGFGDLQKKMVELNFEERREQNDIRLFKNSIFNMLSDIDDFDKLKEGFNNLRILFLKDYKPDVQDMDLDAEFFNQKDNMVKNVEELSSNLKNLKNKHNDNLSLNRQKNSKMIEKITSLKSDIEKQKKEKAKAAADSRHENAIAAINATKALKFLEEKDFEDTEEKIKFLENLVEEKRNQLMKERKESSLVLPNLKNNPHSEEELSEEQSDSSDNL